MAILDISYILHMALKRTSAIDQKMVSHHGYFTIHYDDIKYQNEVYYFTVDERFGLLSTSKMDEELYMQQCDRSVSKLVRTFLNELHIIHQVNRNYCLVPSAINSDPVLMNQAEYGSFPRAAVYQIQLLDSDSLPSVGPMVVNSYDEHHLQVRETGLIYRRMLLLPPIM